MVCQFIRVYMEGLGPEVQASLDLLASHLVHLQAVVVEEVYYRMITSLQPLQLLKAFLVALILSSRVYYHHHCYLNHLSTFYL